MTHLLEKKDPWGHGMGLWVLVLMACAIPPAVWMLSASLPMLAVFGLAFGTCYGGFVALAPAVTSVIAACATKAVPTEIIPYSHSAQRP